MLENIRTPLLEEATKSPVLLSDLAGLEKYIAESYDARSFIELLQNADDAKATRFVIAKSGEFLLVANDGKPFSDKDLESLCRSAASNKVRGTSIGFRGIGFKSVVSFANEVYLVSGHYRVTFSRDRTRSDIAGADRVPLIRIPHSLLESEYNQFAEALDELQQQHFSTIFIFGGLIADAIEVEFAAFEPSSMLFLRSIQQLSIRTRELQTLITARREQRSEDRKYVCLSSSEASTRWQVIERDGVAIAFAMDEGGSIRALEQETATVHAFLPTNETTGFPFKCNGDFSTDPSRTRIVLDERTALSIQELAGLIVELLREALLDDDGSGLLGALVPFVDPRMAKFQKRSFRADLFAAIETAGRSLAELRLRPGWLNAKDFQTLVRAARIQNVGRSDDAAEAVKPLLKFVGAQECTVDELSESLKTVELNPLGCAEIVSQLAGRSSSGQSLKKEAADYKIWVVENDNAKPRSLREIVQHGEVLKSEFMDLVSERVLSTASVKRLVSSLGYERQVEALMPSTTADIIALPNPVTMPHTDKIGERLQEPAIPRLSLKRWRSAEQQVLQLLNAQGWRLEDVSRQNLGYDLDGHSPEGQQAHVEVKLIDSIGQPFILTSNEEAVARQDNTRYYLAIVRQTEVALEIGMLADPLKALTLTRQCRQWVWECTNYNFSPQIFPYD